VSHIYFVETNPLPYLLMYIHQRKKWEYVT